MNLLSVLVHQLWFKLRRVGTKSIIQGALQGDIGFPRGEAVRYIPKDAPVARLLVLVLPPRIELGIRSPQPRVISI